MEDQNLQGLHTNNSGQGVNSQLPPELRRWNFGALGFNWIWGLFNGTYIALLTLIPPISFIMPFVLLVKGNEWAWKNKRWKSVEHFQKVQRAWGLVWLTLIVIGFVLGFISVFFGEYLPGHEERQQQANVESQQRFEESRTDENKRDESVFTEIMIINRAMRLYTAEGTVNAPDESSYKTELLNYGVNSFADPEGYEYKYSNHDSDLKTFYFQFHMKSKPGSGVTFVGINGPGNYCLTSKYDIEPAPCVEK
jgi:hypothetical protein